MRAPPSIVEFDQPRSDLARHAALGIATMESLVEQLIRENEKLEDIVDRQRAIIQELKRRGDPQEG